jgi:hypothetical protein
MYQVASKSNKQKNAGKIFLLLPSYRSMTKITGFGAVSGVGTVSQRYKSADPDLYQYVMDPYQYVTDPPHWFSEPVTVPYPMCGASLVPRPEADKEVPRRSVREQCCGSALVLLRIRFQCFR